MVKGMIKEGNNRIYSIGKTEGEYKAQRRLLSSEAIEVEEINDFIRQRGSKSLQGQQRVFVPIDESEIRKPYSKKLENLMRVRDLDGELINGYRTINSIALTADGKGLFLLETILFSSEEEGFRSENAYEMEMIKRVGEALKQMRADIEIVYLLDRAFDDKKIIGVIEGDRNKFILRVKHLDRLVDTADGEQGERRRLSDIELKERYRRGFEKLRIKNKVYQNVEVVIGYGGFGYQGNSYFLLRVELVDRDRKPIYSSAMYLMTNLDIKCGEDAYKVFKNYLMRGKIEAVFKFLKDVLGWEEFRIRDIAGIKKLIALTYLLGAYFYEIGEAVVGEEFVELVSRLGNGKGKITRGALIKGLKELITTIQTIELLKDNLDDEEIIKLYASIGFKDEAEKIFGQS